MTTWFITGASRGFGRLLTQAALDAGDNVVAGIRSAGSFTSTDDGPLLTVPLDVTDEVQAADAVAAALDRFGRIDVLVNNAGYGLFGAVEEVSDVEVRALFDTNVFGLLNVTRAALPALRAQGSGRIILMGSSAGFVAGAGRGLYGASKFAVEAIGEALRGELEAFGVAVTVVEPGSFRTEFLSAGSRRAPRDSLAAYDDTVGALQRAVVANDGRQPGDPAAAVAAIRRIVTEPEPPLRLQLGSDAVALVESKLAFVTAELDRWRDLALSTDFPADS